MSTSTKDATQQTEFKLPENLKGKIPNQAEEALKQKLNKYALQKCKPQIEALRDCTKNRLFSMAWACKDLNIALNSCLGK